MAKKSVATNSAKLARTDDARAINFVAEITKKQFDEIERIATQEDAPA